MSREILEHPFAIDWEPLIDVLESRYAGEDPDEDEEDWEEDDWDDDEDEDDWDDLDDLDEDWDEYEEVEELDAPRTIPVEDDDEEEW